MIEPRLKTSSKWVSFPTELLDQIKNVFEENFSALANRGKVIVEGRIYPEEIFFRLGYLQNGRLRQHNIEVSADFDPKKTSVISQVHACIDLVGQLFQIWEERDNEKEDKDEFIHVWTPYDYSGQRLFYKNSSINTDLEAAANELLGENVDIHILNTDEESEDLKELQTKLSAFQFDDE